MKKMLILAASLAVLSTAGCSYSGIAFDGDKAYISGAQTSLIKKVYVCNVDADGSLSDCKDAM